MDQQITMNDIIPSETKTAVRQFNEASYDRRREDGRLELCRNRHEGYGLLADGYVGVTGSADGVKAAMKDCLKTLGGEDMDFQESADALYAALTDLSIHVTAMSVQALNVIQQLIHRQGSVSLPLLEKLDGMEAADASEAIPDAEDGYIHDTEETPDE
jgi:hypothetical protein